jgi:hypothetical protein
MFNGVRVEFKAWTIDVVNFSGNLGQMADQRIPESNRTATACPTISIWELAIFC